MMCLNCFDLPPESIYKPRYVSYTNKLPFTCNPTLHGISNGLWWHNIQVNGACAACREVKCTCPHKGLLTAHLGPALCALGFHWPLSIQHYAIVQGWSLLCVDRGLKESWHREQREAYFTSHTHTVKFAEVTETLVFFYLAIRHFLPDLKKKKELEGKRELSIKMYHTL